MNTRIVLIVVILHFLIVTLPQVWSAASIQFVTPKEGKPNECPLDETGLSLPVGERIPLAKGCGRQKCINSGGKLALETTGCGVVHVAPETGCIVSSDTTKPYPDCCPKPKCPKA